MSYLIFIVLLSSGLYATDSSMNKIATHYQTLFPYIMSEKFFDESSEKLIKKELQSLSDALRESNKHFQMQEKPYQLKMSLLSRHINKTHDIFSSGNKTFARSMLRSATQMCVSCHAQDNLTRNYFSPPEDISHLEKAHFYHTTRNFSEAKKHYLDYFKGLTQPDFKINNELKNLLSLYLENKQDPEELRRIFSDLAKKSQFNHAQKVLLNTWVKELASYDKDYLSKKLKETKITKKWLKSQLDAQEGIGEDSQLVTFYVMRKIINEMILSSKTQESDIPQLLLWQSRVERSLNYSFFFPLADLYLEACITQFSSSPLAMECLKELKEQINFSYTGTSGTHVPTEVMKELEELEKKIKR